MDNDKLALLIYSSGYRNQKTIKLKNIAEFYIKNHNKLDDMNKTKT